MNTQDLVLAGAAVALPTALVTRNPEAIGVGVVGLIAFGVLATFVGLTGSFVTGARRE